MLELTDMMQVVGIINTLQYEYKHVKENYKLEDYERDMDELIDTYLYNEDKIIEGKGEIIND